VQYSVLSFGLTALAADWRWSIAAGSVHQHASPANEGTVKGGKAGRGRKSSNARFHGKATSRSSVKKGAAKRDFSVATKKSAKKTTRLGAHRVADDD
jgi:hypothetical protein